MSRCREQSRADEVREQLARQATEEDIATAVAWARREVPVGEDGYVDEGR